MPDTDSHASLIAAGAVPCARRPKFPKGLAASLVGRELFRVDLDKVVSKYIGETEKNLERLIASAAEAGVVLVIDEADALLSKRSEVNDAHDRYANIEINYLLQQVEAQDGVVMLATNRKQALDPAFTRRLRFIVNFPRPGPEDR